MSARRGFISTALSFWAPLASALLLLILPGVMANSTWITASMKERSTEVEAVMKELPYTRGAWVGQDVPVVQAARELLSTNAIFSRMYRKLPDGPHITVVAVYVSDARDLDGHYPPVCYPNAGWTAMRSDSGNPHSSLSYQGTMIPTAVYEFTREDRDGRVAGLRIHDFFVLPNGVMSRDMDDVRRQSSRLDDSMQGSAQIQFVMDRAYSPDEARAWCEELLPVLDELFRSLGCHPEQVQEDKSPE
ncbi:MAG: exosortase-associated EpsI family protein [Phycisphaerales bacterium]